MVRSRASAFSNAAPRDSAASDLVVRAGGDRHLPGTLHARNLYRMDIFRVDGVGLVLLASTSELCPGVSRVGLPCAAGGVRSRFVLHCGESGSFGSSR